LPSERLKLSSYIPLKQFGQHWFLLNRLSVALKGPQLPVTDDGHWLKLDHETVVREKHCTVGQHAPPT